MTDETTKTECDCDSTLSNIARRCVAIAAIAGVVYLITTGHVNDQGWGWLVFIAILAGT